MCQSAVNKIKRIRLPVLHLHFRTLFHESDQATLFVRYIKSGTDNTTVFFSAEETFSASAGVTHGSTSYSTDDISAQVFSKSPTGVGFGVTINAGIYYMRGSFVEVAEETLILEKYSIN